MNTFACQNLDKPAQFNYAIVTVTSLWPGAVPTITYLLDHDAPSMTIRMPTPSNRTCKARYLVTLYMYVLDDTPVANYTQYRCWAFDYRFSPKLHGIHHCVIRGLFTASRAASSFDIKFDDPMCIAAAGTLRFGFYFPNKMLASRPHTWIIRSRFARYGLALHQDPQATNEYAVFTLINPSTSDIELGSRWLGYIPTWPRAYHYENHAIDGGCGETILTNWFTLCEYYAPSHIPSSEHDYLNAHSLPVKLSAKTRREKY